MSVLVYVLNILLLAGMVWVLRKQSYTSSLGYAFYPGLVFKLSCGVLLGLLYQYHYGAGDTLTYFNGSLQLTALARQDSGAYLRLLLFNDFGSEALRASLPFTSFPDFSNSFFIIKIISLLNLLTGSSYYLNALYFSLFSFWGSAKLAAILSKYYPEARAAAIIAFLFFPSIIFWGSGLLKDGIMMGSMCWLVAFALELGKGQPVKPITLILLPFMLYIFVRMKLFLAAVLLPVLLAYLLIRWLAKYKPAFRKVGVQVMVLLMMTVLAGAALTQIGVIYNLDFIFEQVVKNHEVLLAQSLHGPHISLDNLEPTFASMLRHASEAFLSSIYRPFVWESRQSLYLLTGAENLLLLVLTVLSIASFVNGKYKVSLFYVALLIYILVAATMIGLSTPNFGSLSRYRIAFLPFLVYLLLQSYYARLVMERVAAAYTRLKARKTTHL
ncbi:hypothetical protein [Pontibacter ruber]|uniref:Glycosyltransferase RgtA/B/C/D-like domain-containing protein n=1 Tax=Pontibacter ruber TaxID=1343895 RepID=A0ABW5D1P1_9BACT|nr:hypothetical protein [Pontibacter ruber]